LKKGKESFSVLYQLIEWPILKIATLEKELNKTVIEILWHTFATVMSAKQHTEKVGWLLDKFGCDLKDMPKDELLGCIVSQLSRGVAKLGIVERVEMSPVKRAYDRVTEIRKNIAQMEREFTARNY